jgi:Thioredoxin-related protein
MKSSARSLLAASVAFLSFSFLMSPVFGASSSVNERGQAEAAWKWNDLVNRPDRWPPQASLRQEIAFSDGTKFAAGTKVRVTKVMPRQIEVLLPDGSAAELEVDSTDLLEAANRYWATLTPEQRAVDLAAIRKDRTLLPPMVTVHVPLRFPKGELQPGEELSAAEIVNQNLHVWSSTHAQMMAVAPMETDLLFRARALAALPLEERVKAPWLTNYTEALGKARAEDRKVFLFFTGSDWCGWCMRLDREVLRMPEFTDFAAENLVLVKVDFPRKTRLPAAEAAQNQKLAQQYGVRGYPTVVVLNAKGEKVGELGYQEGGPQPFVAQIRTM